ncbi:hypothetical protein CUMW_254720 [Citrus unshiu]|uniref:Protein kinase domain-containing protein n=1 Tax=Citrus unshiu TaxID=55188 RepID=A0A2H5QRE9_CITUN|nr:hypothetical protein CUMW_254720 [Citrus unshiu]
MRVDGNLLLYPKNTIDENIDVYQANDADNHQQFHLYLDNTARLLLLNSSTSEIWSLYSDSSFNNNSSVIYCATLGHVELEVPEDLCHVKNFCGLNNYCTWKYMLKEECRKSCLEDCECDAALYESDSKKSVGKCSFGTVYKGTLHKGEKFVVVKRLRSMVTDCEREFRAEMHVISLTHHKNLIWLIGYFIEDSMRLLVYEYMSNVSRDEFYCAATRVALRRLLAYKSLKKSRSWALVGDLLSAPQKTCYIGDPLLSALLLSASRLLC